MKILEKAEFLQRRFKLAFCQKSALVCAKKSNALQLTLAVRGLKITVMNVLALCGSIRNNSSNHALLSAVQKLFPLTVNWKLFEIKNLPFFDPQLQFGEHVPEVVRELRLLAKNADLIIIASPEYAHGIPGILKNALEWLVCEESMKKRAVVLIASPSGGEFLKEYLTETLRTMDLVIPPESVMVVTTARTQISPEGEIHDKELSIAVKKFIDRLLTY